MSLRRAKMVEIILDTPNPVVPIQAIKPRRTHTSPRHLLVSDLICKLRPNFGRTVVQVVDLITTAGTTGYHRCTQTDIEYVGKGGIEVRVCVPRKPTIY